MYCTPTDVRLALTPGASATDLETPSHFEDTQLEDAIAEADGVINTYIGSWYTIPSVIIELEEDPFEAFVAPGPVRTWSRDIAAYLATLTFMKNKNVTEDDPVRQRYAMVMRMLTDIRDRKSYLDPEVFPPNDANSNQQGVAIFNTYEGKLFGPQDFKLAPEGYANPQVFWPHRSL
jgi:phage gp36-like protein